MISVPTIRPILFSEMTWVFSKHLTAKRVAVGSVIIALSVGGYQGLQLKKKFASTHKLSPPKGPSDGLINRFRQTFILLKSKPLVDDLKDDDSYIGDKVKSMFATILEKIKQKGDDSFAGKENVKKITEWIESRISASSQINNESTSTPKKRIKLLLLGDSLVAGIGCETDTHILPVVLAKALSLSLGADVEWKMASIVGGTVAELRSELLPAIKSDFLNVNIDSNRDSVEEVIVVVICGLNDFKHMVYNFPLAGGPVSFSQNLKELIVDLRQDLNGIPCRVFLPSLPISICFRDPKFLFNVAPFSYLFSMFTYVCDNQKHSVAFDDSVSVCMLVFYMCS